MHTVSIIVPGSVLGTEEHMLNKTGGPTGLINLTVSQWNLWCGQSSILPFFWEHPPFQPGAAPSLPTIVQPCSGPSQVIQALVLNIVSVISLPGSCMNQDKVKELVCPGGREVRWEVQGTLVAK